jgi:hypothetical protein
MIFQDVASPPNRNAVAKRLRLKLSPEIENTMATRMARMPKVIGSSCQKDLTPNLSCDVKRCP